MVDKFHGKQVQKMTGFDGKKILVTGASGFIGSWIVKSLLDKKAEVICLLRDFVPDSLYFAEGLDKKTIRVLAELEDFNSIERAINEYAPEFVLHLGAQTIVGTANNSPIGTFNSNIRGTWNLLEACRMHDKTVSSIVIASSDKAYGEQKNLPYTEESPLNAKNPYDVSKACSDILAQSYGATYGLPVSISRCGNFFGGGDLNFSRLVPSTIQSTYQNKNPVIRSDGKYVRDYIYVEDAVDAYEVLLAATEKKKFNGEAFNFSNEVQLQVIELVKKILSIMNKSGLKPLIKNEAKGEIKNQHLSAKKARETLGWKSKWTIDDGLKKTIKWYADYFAKH